MILLAYSCATSVVLVMPYSFSFSKGIDLLLVLVLAKILIYFYLVLVLVTKTTLCATTILYTNIKSIIENYITERFTNLNPLLLIEKVIVYNL